MNKVVFYSNTGQSKAIAAYFANQLGYPLADIETKCAKHYRNLVLVFPVHCQNIPGIVKTFLKNVAVENLTVVATYGKMCCGNVLYEIQKKYQKNIVAGAYVPTKHSYIDDDGVFRDFDKLKPIVEKAKDPSYIQLPGLYKNPLADILPKLRSRLGLAIQKSADCNGCNLCAARCSFGAIKKGKINSNCVRCLRCVESCPQQALRIKLRLPLKLYLRKKKTNKLIIYV
ncbi:MAG: 4Fe-4S binding protein [Clostridia bacterium]|nr:4Fe-4S binding protein [Clostridia bacterium]